MLSSGKFNAVLCNGLWAEAANTDKRSLNVQMVRTMMQSRTKSLQVEPTNKRRRRRILHCQLDVPFPQ